MKHVYKVELTVQSPKSLPNHKIKGLVQQIVDSGLEDASISADDPDMLWKDADLAAGLVVTINDVAKQKLEVS